MSDTIEPINARQARRLTVKRVIAISYGTTGSRAGGAPNTARITRGSYSTGTSGTATGLTTWMRCWADSTGRP